MQTTLTSTAAETVPKAASNPNDPADDTNLEWLNAYNAPHWVNVYKALDIPTDARLKKSISGNFIDGTTSKMEIYSTSWTLDLLKAWEISKPQLVAQGLISATTMLQLDGLTDPTYGEPLHEAGGHSVGMSIDLGVGTFISRAIQNSLNNAESPRRRLRRVTVGAFRSQKTCRHRPICLMCEETTRPTPCAISCPCMP